MNEPFLPHPSLIGRRLGGRVGGLGVPGQPRGLGGLRPNVADPHPGILLTIHGQRVYDLRTQRAGVWPIWGIGGPTPVCQPTINPKRSRVRGWVFGGKIRGRLWAASQGASTLYSLPQGVREGVFGLSSNRPCRQPRGARPVGRDRFPTAAPPAPPPGDIGTRRFF